MSTTLAFDVERSTRRYHLRLARYQGMVDVMRWFRQTQTAGRPLALLDVGAGQGRTLRYLKAAGLDEGIAFTGIDNAAQRRDRLFEAERWDYRLGDIEQGLPYDDEAFDVVICEQVLEHLTRPQYVMQEIHRVLRPGGVVILGVPNFPPGFAEFRRHVVPRLDRLTGKRRDHEQVFTRRSFLDMITGTTDLHVEAVQAFRCVSGGILAPLENHHWWYRLNRHVATTISSLATEIQIVARKPRDEVRTPVTDKLPMQSHGADEGFHAWAGYGLPAAASVRTTLGAFAMLVGIFVISAMFLSDRTSHWLYADQTGLMERLSVWLWLAMGVGLVAVLRSAPTWIIAASAGTCVLAGAIEGRWHQWAFDHSRAELAVGVVCALVAAGTLFHLLRRSRGLSDRWVRLLLLFFAAMAVAETIEHAHPVLDARFGITVDGVARNIMLAFEEGTELMLPVLLGVTAMAWAHAQAPMLAGGRMVKPPVDDAAKV